MNALDALPTSGLAADGPAAPTALDAQTRFGEPADVAAKDELGQTEFLELMLTQIQHQDPFEPTDNGDFIAQMAQFSTVEGIGDMQSSLDDMAASFGAQQTLEASSLVGRDVLVTGDALPFDGRAPAAGRYVLERPAASVTLLVQDASGALVSREELGAAAAGRHDFAWDGRDADGEPMPAGQYRATVVYGNGEGEGDVPAETLLQRRVEAVEFGAGGAVLVHTDAGETLGLDALREIRETTPDASDS